jgi:hypothetical protein
MSFPNEGRQMTVEEERERRRQAEELVLRVLRFDRRVTPADVLRAAAHDGFDRGEIAAAIWRLAGVRRVEITDDLHVRRVS